MPLSESAATGDRLAALRDLRGILATAISDCASARDLASLTARFQSVLAEIAELEGARKAGGPGDPADEIAARRAARGGSAARSRRAGAGQG